MTADIILLGLGSKKYEADRKKTYPEMIRLYSEVKGIYGYRRMTLNIRSRLKKSYNHKRIYRLMKSVPMQSVIRRKKRRYIVTEPRITAENLLNREFTV